MENVAQFLNSILDSISENIVVIDAVGNIQYTNQKWDTFEEGSCSKSENNWLGANYIEVCDQASAMGDEFGLNAAKGIRKVINKEIPIFYFEYPCHSPDVKRWFMMRVNPFQINNEYYFVISHQDITERKLAEEEVRSLARIDGLTGIPNRRTFDEFLNLEWKRCARLNKKLCLAIIDLDHFKILNDTFGHQAGDECLKKVANLLRYSINRPSDLCARYGGDEFVLVLGDTSREQANNLLNLLSEKIQSLKILSSDTEKPKYLTASIGIAEATPTRNNTETESLGLADRMLYLAKRKGRDRVEC